MAAPMIKNDLDVVDGESMSDKLIRVYLKGARILLYNDLARYASIEEVLPGDKSYVILLYCSEPNVPSGHWTCVTRLRGEISYFDSYGKPPDYAIDHWFRGNTGQQVKYLSGLFDKTRLPVYWSDVAYQSKAGDIATCGRHVIFYILNMQKKGRDLAEYYTFMHGLKEKTGMSYDDLVSYFVNLID